ncbi:T9SS type A sorting domain-containing protein [bacterium]|nr:T9SS type A sorting domain-containing protein [bacterium]
MPLNKIIIPLLLLLSASFLFGEVIQVNLNYTQNDFTFRSYGHYDQVYLRDGEISGRPGEPQLPTKAIHVLIPPNAVIEDITTEITRRIIFRDGIDLFPAQPPHILPMPDVAVPPPTFVEPDPGTYSTDKLLPKEAFTFTKTGNLSGFKIASGIFYPLQYNPATKILYLIEEAIIHIEYNTGGTAPLHPNKRSQISLTTWENFVKRLVVNPQDFGNYYSHYLAPMEDAYDYLIITDNSLAPILDQLKDWKLTSGLKDTIVTTSDIYSSYAGVDNAEKIREFIKDAYTDWGITWVLLAGDVYYIPARTVWAFDCEAHFYDDENDIRADLYFSDLDGDWNFNANDTFGEVGDSVDMYPEVFVGRASHQADSEMVAWTEKLLDYEKTPSTGYLNKMLFLAMVLWDEPLTDASIAKEMIDENYVPDYYTITKLYQTLGNENSENTIAAMNSGQGFINHNGHASRWVLGVGHEYLWPNDMDELTNGSMQGVFYSIGCWPASFDYDCIGEHYISNPDGGGVAFIGNSRYGWGSPGNPGYGYSEVYDERFHDALFTKDILAPGEILAYQKAYYAPYAAWENIWRWHQYEINLLGEPEMQIWSNEPSEVVVRYPDSITNSGGMISVCVEDLVGGAIGGARVALSQNSTLIASDVTNPTGCVLLNVAPTSPDSVLLTVTGKNIFPFQHWINVFFSGTYISLENWVLFDTTGAPLSGTGVAPGDSLTMTIKIKNTGTEVSENVTANIALPENIDVLEESFDCGDLAPGDTFIITTSLNAHPGLYNGDPAPIVINITDSEGDSWHYTLDVHIKAPELSEMFYTVVSSGEDLIVEPGESATVEIVVDNTGPVEPLNAKVSLYSEDPYIVTPEGNFSITFFSADSGVSAPMDIEILPTAPSPHFALIIARVTTARGLTFNSSFNFVIGDINFFDDIESGDGLWTTEGPDNLWHITDRRSHSGSHSWWCGDDVMEVYEDNLYCPMKTLPIIVSDNAQLSFWLYYDVANYGVDGIYVDIIHQSDTTRESYIGSGGALDSTLSFLVGWSEYTYDLSYIPPGDTIEVLITMTSDNDLVTSEGFYIDDVSVGSQPVAFTLFSEYRETPIQAFEINGIYPNPFNGKLTVSFSLPEDGTVSYRVYDLMGRVVHGEEDNLGKGLHTLTWDGSDDEGRGQPSGIYFIRISDGCQELIEKVLYLK